MFKIVWFAILLSIIVSHAGAQSQESPVKFKDFVFTSVQVQKDLLYRQDSGISERYSRFNFFEPAGDTTAYRPLIIWLHGGGFKFGKKTSGGLPLWGKTFAQRGYVCAAINYRLSKRHPLKNYADLVAGCATAMQDVNEAIGYFKTHYRQFRIDTNCIILGGNSAGGMIALQAVYSSPAALAQLIHDTVSISPHIKLPHLQHIAAVINYWGALFDLSFLQHASVPIASVHGKKDRVVPYAVNKAGLYGSLAIHQTADSLHIPNTLKVYDGYAHELQKHFNPLFAGRGARKRWAEAGAFTAAFLHAQLFGIK